MIREQLNEAFKAIRKQGLIAKQNFWCCACCAIGQQVDKLKADGKKVPAGAVYYTKQDAARIREFESHGLRKSKSVFIGFGKTEGSKVATVEIGKIAVKAFEEAGLVVKWDGSEATRIEVSFEPKPVPPVMHYDI